jgi:hypothetical protein
MSEYAIQPLDAATWDAFVHLAQKHNGVWNGCWCTWFHPACAEKGESPGSNRLSGGASEHLPPEGVQRRPRQGAGLPPYLLLRRQELPAQRRRSRGASWCPGSDRKAGGGVVEAYPQDTLGKRTSGSFLYNGTRSLFEKAGFSYERSKGKNHCVMRRTVTPR